jgi:DNA transformation protein
LRTRSHGTSTSQTHRPARRQHPFATAATGRIGPDAAAGGPDLPRLGLDLSAVSTIPNLGPASEAAFAKVGINTAEELRDLGADAAYLRLLQSGIAPHFIGYYALVMGLQGRPWNDCKGEEKKALRQRFDALKEKLAPANAIESALNELGVILPR